MDMARHSGHSRHLCTCSASWRCFNIVSMHGRAEYPHTSPEDSSSELSSSSEEESACAIAGFAGDASCRTCRDSYGR